MGNDVVQLTVLPSEADAEMVVSLLRSNGIEAFTKRSDMGSATFGGAGPFGAVEVWVSEAMLAEAREFLAASPEPGER
ncbi:MAG TPA: DUF2007 domain-containing protein [Gaiellaceae bacterium]|nr:DUF2007 domain-containing protein [Gaiellaceae bacterium]